MPEDAPWPAGAVGDAEILSVVRVKTPTYDDVAALCHVRRPCISRRETESSSS